MGISNFLGNVKIQGGMSHFQRNVILLKENVTLLRKCQTVTEFKEISAFKGMSHFQGNVKLSRKCHTYKGMSNFQRNVTLKGMSHFHGNISFQGNVTLSLECQTF